MTKELKKRFITSFFLIIVLYLSLINNYVLALALLTILFIALNEFHNIFLKIFSKNKIINLILIFLSLTYLTFFCLLIWLFLSSKVIENITLLIFILSICIFTDIGGYLFGKIFKGKKITKISPNKTYSGMFGSFIMSFLVTIFFYNEVNLFINIFIFTFIISLLSQIGDLIISYLKRKAMIKDTGSFLPGHGGLLDRIDGIMLALPIGLIMVSL